MSIDWDEVRDRVFAIYGDNSYAEGLEIIRNARAGFPDRDSVLTFWEACFLSLDGQGQAAIAALEPGLERGLFWDPRMLADPDLDAARQLDRWRRMEQRSGALADSFEFEVLPPMIREVPEPVGTMVVLHGAGDIPDDAFAEFDAATPSEWRLVAPIGNVPISDVKRAWPYDLATDSLMESLETLDLNSPIVLAGFSQGARLAAKVAWDGLIDASGLILTAAVLTPNVWDQTKKMQVPLYAVIGTEDMAYEPSLTLLPRLEDAGVPVHFDIREGLGHELPEDLDEVIRTGLEWIAGI